jgi:hypothetical protein
VVEELLEIDGRHFKITLGTDSFVTVVGDDSGILAEDMIINGKNDIENRSCSYAGKLRDGLRGEHIHYERIQRAA